MVCSEEFLGLEGHRVRAAVHQDGEDGLKPSDLAPALRCRERDGSLQEAVAERHHDEPVLGAIPSPRGHERAHGGIVGKDAAIDHPEPLTGKVANGCGLEIGRSGRCRARDIAQMKVVFRRRATGRQILSRGLPAPEEQRSTCLSVGPRRRQIDRVAGHKKVDASDLGEASVPSCLSNCASSGFAEYLRPEEACAGKAAREGAGEVPSPCSTYSSIRSWGLSGLGRHRPQARIPPVDVPAIRWKTSLARCPARISRRMVAAMMPRMPPPSIVRIRIVPTIGPVCHKHCKPRVKIG